MRLRAVSLYPALVALTLLSAAAPAHAEDIRVFSSVAMRAVIDEVAPRFERETRHRVVITYGVAAIRSSICAGVRMATS